MSFTCLACFVFCFASTQEETLEIANHRRTYGYLGPLRTKDTGSLPGDTAHFSFDIKNLKLDDAGKASFSVAIEIRDEAGKLIFEQRPYNSVAQNFLGGNSLPCSAHVEIPLDAKPGVVDWKVTVVDRSTKQSTFLKGKGKILPRDFGIVGLGLFADAENRVPMSAIAVVGDSAYLHLSTVGFGRNKETAQPDLEVSMRILDEKGQPTMGKPVVGKINSGVNPKDEILPVQFGISLNRTGRYTIELTATDRISGKRSQINYAIRVLPLE